MASREKADRAKIFAPFDALRGFREALAAKERIIVPRIELSEEAREELDRKVRNIQKSDMVTVVYFHGGDYIKTTGIVSRLDVNCRFLQIVNTKIPFDDIYDIQGEQF